MVGEATTIHISICFAAQIDGTCKGNCKLLMQREIVLVCSLRQQPHLFLAKFKHVSPCDRQFGHISQRNSKVSFFNVSNFSLEYWRRLHRYTARPQENGAIVSGRKSEKLSLEKYVQVYAAIAHESTIKPFAL